MSNSVLKTVLILLWALVTTLGCGSESDEPGGRILVAVSMNPLVSLVSSVGGEGVGVVRLVPPGACPPTFAPTPSQDGRLGRADLLVLGGLLLEF